MMTNSNWDSLQVFTITSATGTSNIYANGRQQAKLRITLQAIDINGTPVPMTPRELDSLQLIDTQGRLIDADTLDYQQRFTDSLTLARQQYHPEEYDRVASGGVAFDAKKHDRLQFNKYRREFYGVNWMWSRVRNKDYQFYPRAPGEQEPLATLASAGRYIYTIDVYVRTISKIPLTIAVQLTRADGTKMMSNSGSRDKATLRLNPVAVPNYSAREYAFQRKVIEGNVESKQYFDSLDYYAFRLFSNQTEIEFLRFDMSPLSIRRDAVAPRNRGSITGFTYPGDEYFNFGMALQSLPMSLNPGFRQRGRAYICLARRSRFNPVPGGINRDPSSSRGPSTIRALDMYGNDHVVRLQFKGNGRNYLELA